jgi:hypothetical protein
MARYVAVKAAVSDLNRQFKSGMMGSLGSNAPAVTGIAYWKFGRF